MPITEPVASFRDHMKERLDAIETPWNRSFSPAMVIRPQFVMSIAEWEGCLETLDILSTPGELDAIKAAAAEIENGGGINGETFLAEFRSKQP